MPEELPTTEPFHDAVPEPGRKRAYRGGVRLEQKQQTQARVLDAALRHFGEHGYEAATLRDIATQAGVSHGIVRLHYGSKEALWKEAVRYLFERQDAELRGRYTAAQLQDNPRQVFEQMLRGFVEYSARHPEHIRIMVRESMGGGGGERLAWMAEHFIAPLHQRMEVLLKHGIRAGLLPDQPLVSLIYILVGACKAMAMLATEVRAIHGVDALHPSIVSKHADAVVATLLRMPAAPAAPNAL